jgi:hypothetical protein
MPSVTAKLRAIRAKNCGLGSSGSLRCSNMGGSTPSPTTHSSSLADFGSGSQKLAISPMT